MIYDTSLVAFNIGFGLLSFIYLLVNVFYYGKPTSEVVPIGTPADELE
jgi:hypothetical protein